MTMYNVTLDQGQVDLLIEVLYDHIEISDNALKNELSDDDIKDVQETRQRLVDLVKTIGNEVPREQSNA